MEANYNLLDAENIPDVQVMTAICDRVMESVRRQNEMALNNLREQLRMDVESASEKMVSPYR